jgi:hypothetical protein
MISDDRIESLLRSHKEKCRKEWEAEVRERERKAKKAAFLDGWGACLESNGAGLERAKAEIKRRYPCP